MTILSLNSLRKSLDALCAMEDFDANLPSKLSELSIMGTQPEDNDVLQAWVPMVTVTCISEAGTTSDKCSSAKSLCRCGVQEEDEDFDYDPSNPIRPMP